MADDKEEQPAEKDSGEKAGGGGKKKIILLVLVALILVASTVGGTLFMLGFFDSEEPEGEQAEEVAEQEVIDKPPAAMYFPIKPAFVVNFQSRGRQRFLQVDITVLTRDMEVFNALQTHSPLIKNRLLMLLGGEIYEELQTDEGKELLRQKALEALQDIMQQELGKPAVEQVLFTNFVMQ